MIFDNLTITPEKFVQEFSELKDSLVKDYFDSESPRSRIDILKTNGFNESQIELVITLMDDSLTDALYTVLLGLDGCASISQKQITYKLQNEKGNELTGNLEGLAYEAFHEV